MFELKVVTAALCADAALYGAAYLALTELKK